MARLDISLLGGFQVTMENKPVHAFESDKGRALLAYLVVENQRPHRRESLAALFWPNNPEASARSNLRQTLHRLHNTLAQIPGQAPYLLKNSQEIQFNRESDYHLDVEAFTQQLAILDSHHGPSDRICDSCRQGLESVMSIYQGDFMSGFSLSKVTRFDWWILCKQEEYHHHAVQALIRLAEDYEKRQDYACSLHFVRHIIAMEPWNEIAHQHCMRLLVMSGQRAAALRQYDACREILAAEMGITPSPPTDQLREQILNEK